MWKQRVPQKMFLTFLLPLFLACVSCIQTLNYPIGINLCKVKCMERGSCQAVAYDIKTLTCRQLTSSLERQETEGYIVFRKGKDQMPSAGACSMKTFVTTGRCLENRWGREVCVHDYDNPDAASKAATVAPGKPVNMLNRRCKDGDCPGSLKCYKGTCKCPVKLRSNPVDNTCIKRCNVYGDGWTVYKGLYTTHNNRRGFFFRNMKSCCRKCLTIASFTCASYQYNAITFSCYVLGSGWTDYPLVPIKREQNLWYFATRNCA